MDMKAVIRIGVGALGGLLVARAVWSGPPPKTNANATDDAGADDVDVLRRANTNLTESLDNSERTIARLRAQLEAAKVPRPSSSFPFGEPFMGGDGGARRARYAELTAADWAEMAEAGAVAVTLPCLHDESWTIPKSAAERLGLSAASAAIYQASVLSSNKRVANLVMPQCSKALGRADAAQLVGARTCLDVVINAAKKADLDGTHEALVRIARSNATGKNDAKPAAGAAQLLVALGGENNVYEAELAAKLGADEARRITTSPDHCVERFQFQAKGDRYEIRPPGVPRRPPPSTSPRE